MWPNCQISDHGNPPGYDTKAVHMTVYCHRLTRFIWEAPVFLVPHTLTSFSWPSSKDWRLMGVASTTAPGTIWDRGVWTVDCLPYLVHWQGAKEGGGWEGCLFRQVQLWAVTPQKAHTVWRTLATMSRENTSATAITCPLKSCPSSNAAENHLSLLGQTCLVLLEWQTLFFV